MRLSAVAGARAQTKRLLGTGPASGMYSRMPPSQPPSRSRAPAAVTASTKRRRSSLGVRGSAAVAVVLYGRGVGDLGGDGLDRAVVCRALAGGAVVEAAQLRGPRRDDGLAEQAADVGGDAGRIGPARRPLEQDLAGGALAQGCDGGRVGAGQVVGDDEAVARGLPGSKSAAGRPSIAAAAVPRIWLDRSGSSATDCGAVPAASRISLSRASAAAQLSAESLT